jgi:ABC-type transporter MlaC component
MFKELNQQSHFCKAQQTLIDILKRDINKISEQKHKLMNMFFEVCEDYLDEDYGDKEILGYYQGLKDAVKNGFEIENFVKPYEDVQ